MLLPLLFLAASAPAIQDPYAALRSLKAIPGQIEFQYADDHTKSVDGGGSIEFRSARSGTATAKLPGEPVTEYQTDFVSEAPLGQARVDDRLVFRTGGGEASQTEAGGGSLTDSRIVLSIDWDQRTYTVIGRIAVKTKVVIAGPQGTSEQDNVAGIEFASADLPLPKNTGSIRGTLELPPDLIEPNHGANLGTNLVPMGIVYKRQDGGRPNSATVRYQFGKIEAPQDVELVVETPGWKEWMPEGPLPSGSGVGNRFGLTAKLRTKDGSPLKTKAAWVRFEMVGTSKEPGECLNLPVRAEAASEEEADLKFLAEGDATDVQKEGQAAETPRGAYAQATATLGSFDWGGTTEIRVTASIPNKGEIVGTFLANGAPSLLLPKRAADSRIADAWKAQARVADGAKDADDAERSEGNANDGDGYSLYEEYRGVVARGEHSRKSANARLDPNVKDLAVLVDPSLSGEERGMAKAGFRTFEAAARKAHVVEMAPNEAPESREINANGAYAKAVAQHGVRLVKSKIEDAETGGEGSAVGGAFPLGKPKKTPGLTTHVAIDFDAARKGYEGQAAVWAAAGIEAPYAFMDEIANTVAHELAHAVGVNHHGALDTSSPYYPTVPSDATAPNYRIFGVDGVEIATRPYRLQGNVGRAENRASGDSNCLMAYNNYYTWTWTPEGRGGVWRAILPTMRPGTALCTGKDGATPNARFGPAGPNGGNCLSKLRFRDSK